jgi:hypothetical protein
MKHRISKTFAIAGLVGVTGYLWYTDNVSLEAIAIAVLAVIVFYGDGVQSEKIDGLHWRVANLGRFLGHAPENDTLPRP